MTPATRRIVARQVIDLFGGPGGWDVAADAMGLHSLGVEIDEAACQTRHAAGLHTLQADVSALDPLAVLGMLNDDRRAACEADGVVYAGDLEVGDLYGLLASPPCQSFSMAGKGAGRRAMDAYGEAIRRMAAGEPVDRAKLDVACEDERAHLVLEPLRWAMALRPQWVACEQVEPVLPLWEEMALALRRLGYTAKAAVLSAEQYGVPQTRERAILIARRDETEARMPPPSHQKYVAPKRKKAQEESLFEAPEPVRIVLPGEEHLQPWVSMAEALGWGMTARPYPVIASSRSSGGGPDKEKVGGSHARAVIYDEQAAGRWCLQTEEGGPCPPTGITVEHRRGGDRLAETWSADRPSDTVTTRIDRWRVWPAGAEGGAPVRFRSNDRPKAAERSVDEPAPTITAGKDHGERVWLRAGTGEHEAERPQDEPAPTLRFGARLNTVAWVTKTEDGCNTPVGDPEATAAGAPTHYDRRQGSTREDGKRDLAPLVPVSAPAPALGAKGLANGRDRWVTERPAPTVVTARRSKDGLLVGRQMDPGEGENIGGWGWERPATTVQGDPRVHPPGHKMNADDEAAGRDGYEGRAGQKAVRVTIEEAAILQSFPTDYPWRGTKTAVFTQIGNAIPPLLAYAVLAEVTSGAQAARPEAEPGKQTKATPARIAEAA